MKHLKLTSVITSKASFHTTEGYEIFWCSGKFMTLFLVKSTEKTKIVTSERMDTSEEIDPFSLN